MTQPESAVQSTRSSNPITLAVNVLTAPSEAFSELDRHPSKLFPLLLLVGGNVLVLFWYFTIIDFSWYIDDTLSLTGNLSEEQLEAARETMMSMSQTTFRIIGIISGSLGVLVMYVVQAGYLSMASALNGDKYRFGHWFSLICWTSLPALLSIVGMVVTILLSPNGQISSYDLNPLTLTNMGMTSSNESVQFVFNILSLNMLWSISLVVLAYRQWLASSWNKALAIVLAPYLLILGVWAYFALF